MMLQWALLFTLLAMPAYADTTVTTTEGRCVSVLVLRQALNPEVCQETLTNSAYSNGLTAYVFTLSANPVDVSLFTFIGDSHDLLHDGQTTIQPIETVNYIERGRSLHLDAIGSCRITSQHEGLPSVVSCAADTERGRFAADFVSDAKPASKRVP